jgi:outer membrane protein assembly factor BamB
MRISGRSIGAMAGCLVLIGAAVASAQDWPQWRGVNRDGKVTGFAAPAKWPAALSQKWSVPVGTGCATPALVGDRLYVFARQGNEEVTLCLNAADGKGIWKDKVAALAVTGPAARHPGPRSSPAVAGGKVVTFGVGGVLSCLDAADGKVLWRKDEFPKVVPRFFTSMSPLIVDGTVIAYLGGPGNGALVALDLATGNPTWRWAVEGPDYGSPVLMTADGTKQIVTPTEKSIVGVGAADGKLLWQIPFVPQGRAYNSATPVVDGSTVIVTGSGRGTRALKVAKQGDGFAATTLWSNTDVAAQFCTPVLKDGLLFGLSDRGTLFCLNAQTGQAAWTDSVQRDRGSFTALVDAGPVLLALPSSSELVVFKPGDKAYAEVARIKIAETPVYAHPVVAGNRVFVKGQESVALLTLE